LIFVDKRAPAEARQNLSKYGELIEFSTRYITYDAISGHPDIFLTQSDSELIVAPNIPVCYKEILVLNRIRFSEGDLPVSSKYPQSARYNAVVTDKYVIHNPQISDPYLKQVTADKYKISVKQGYTRCNLIPLNENMMITSNAGIRTALENTGIRTLFANPANILLPGFEHGFFGGACGIHGGKIFLMGNLDFIDICDELRKFIYRSGLEIIELYRGPLFDGGGIFFVE